MITAIPDLETVGQLDSQLASSGTRAEQVLDYLSSGEVILATAQRTDDEIGGRPFCIPGVIRSDGVWVWTEALVYYVRTYQLRVPDGLLEHMAANDFKVPAFSPAESVELANRWMRE